MFEEGIDGFKGGLSADNYISISKTSRATATRDLQDLVEKGALTKTGSGTASLTAAGSSQGNVSVDAGTLQFGQTGAFNVGGRFIGTGVV